MKKLFFLLLTLAATATQAQDLKAPRYQKPAVTEGEISFLLKQKSILMEFDYSNMQVGKMTEEAYVAETVADKNKKQAGEGDLWKEKWLQDRALRFEPGFELSLSRYLSGKKYGFQFKSKANASECQYKMVVHTSFTEPGFFTYVVNQNAMVQLNLSFIDLKSNKTVAKIVIFGIGDGRLPDVGTRVSLAYNYAGAGLGAFIHKTNKKAAKAQKSLYKNK